MSITDPAGARTDVAAAPTDPAGARRFRPLRQITGAVILVLVVLVVLRPRMPVNAYSPLAAGLIFGLALLLWVLVGDRLTSLARRLLPTDRIVAAVAAALVLLNGLIAGGVGYLGAYKVGWDASVFPFVAGLPIPEWPPWYVEYFSRYPNNHAMLGLADVAAASARIGLGYVSFMALYAGVAAALTALALYRVVVIARGGRPGIAALAVLVILVSLSPWMGVAYTDMVGVWVPITAVWCLVSGLSRPPVPGLLLELLAGVLLGMGYLIKTTPIVGVVAGVLTLGLLALERGSRGRRRQLLLAVAALLVGTAVGLVGLRAVVARTVPMPVLDRTVQASPWTYVAAGIHTTYYPDGERVFAYGGYNGDLDLETWNKPKAEQDELSRIEIGRDLERRGVLGTIMFEVDKFVFNNGDGMFWAYGEGSDLQAPRLHTGPLADALAAVNGPDGGHYHGRVLLTQVLWLAVLAAAGAGLVGLRRTLSPQTGVAVDLMIWNMIGIAAFMLLFQGRSRYLFGHVPVMIGLAMSVVPILRWPGARSRPVDREASRPGQRDE
ncbi:hypothetical protein [Raineyella sp.]|uniref:Glycosyltransferase RgtA/B/C/D-like domain-containing protein n=1 Tax=bioreactor metagenome TaxID=1076179 RepID=A0A644YIN2_9ZZZZ|nr:hypothetical protein [Raineyella sp.]MEA5153646.1 hypothetical protein [Raineyella sp.]